MTTCPSRTDKRYEAACNKLIDKAWDHASRKFSPKTQPNQHTREFTRQMIVLKICEGLMSPYNLTLFDQPKVLGY